MTPTLSSQDDNPEGGQADSSGRSRQGDLAAVARELVDKVGVEGATRYCHGLGWLGVLAQIELLRQGH